MEAPDFWDDAEVSQKKMKELKDMKDDMETYQNLVTQMEDMETMIEMGYEENDPALIPEIQEMLDEFQKDFDNIRIKTLLSGEYDSENAIIKLNAGAGGTEACDWCGMLYRMYSRWADKKGFTLEVLDYLDGDEAGIKSVTFQVNGTNAYGYLKSEKGVHRLVRISPFNAAGKRQTSFVSCDVMPDIEEDLDVEINDDDLRIEAILPAIPVKLLPHPRICIHPHKGTAGKRTQRDDPLFFKASDLLRRQAFRCHGLRHSQDGLLPGQPVGHQGRIVLHMITKHQIQLSKL